MTVFRSPVTLQDETNGSGIRPVIFDILGPDEETSILPDYLKLVLHTNPNTMKLAYQKIMTLIQTKGGWVEQHWGDGLQGITFDMATGGFMRLYSGLSDTTGGGTDLGGTRRDTIAYDKSLDLLSLFHNNGAIYDNLGNIVLHGAIKVSFDGHSHIGWFGQISVNEAVEKPYQFSISTSFTVKQDLWELRTTRHVHNTSLQQQAQQSQQTIPLDTPNITTSTLPQQLPAQISGNTGVA